MFDEKKKEIVRSLTEAYLESEFRFHDLVPGKEANFLGQKRATRNDDFLSSFVRQIEYFKGIVFMTTDLTDPIDAAVRSRAQIHLTFSSLTSPMRMQVWCNLIDVVPKELGVLSEVDITELAKWKMNGREIKNTINMAITWCQKNNKPLDIGAVEDLISLVSPFATKESSPEPTGGERAIKTSATEDLQASLLDF
ncbi:hypothetical protein B0T24DRAFT_672499 [Lasiosphaeria ovina]|uniref:Uncharacterized protein n=1 Tax=Lasiosphaeria ovina TaxID=92902 RepID=A0AAE0TX00_9PEZI|nr:hypothetical protein B0T24DRAFT_672499 [Lasiosphaeria ovina]